MTTARKKGLPVVLDAGSVREGTADLVAHCSDVISSSGFAPALTGEANPQSALMALSQMGPERVAQTFGQNGCLALVDQQVVHVPAFDVPVVDTTGCGDAFHAGYTFALGKGMSFLKSLEFGSAVAAIKCRDWGGRKGLPELAEVKALITHGKRHSQQQ